MDIRNVLKFLYSAFGNILIFFFYLFVIGRRWASPENNQWFDPFFRVETNVDRINPLLFIPLALILYGTWLGIQYGIMRLYRSFDFNEFLNEKFTTPYLLAMAFGWLNILIFLVPGMEWNVFGFLFFLPLLIIAAITAVLELLEFLKREPRA